MTATIAALSSRGERGLGMPLPWEIVPGGIVVVGPPDIEYINIDSIDGVKDSDRRYRDPRDWPIYAETTRCKWKHIYIKVYNCCPDVEDPSDFSDTPKTQSAEKGLDERISKVFEQCCIVVHYELVKPSSDDCSTYKDFENLPAHDKGTTCYATLTLQERSAYTKKGDDVTGEGGRDAKGNRKGMAFCDRGVNVTTAAHEIGHAFELWHERTDGKKREPQDIMNETNDKGPDGRGMGSVKQFKFAEEDCKTLRSKACDK